MKLIENGRRIKVVLNNPNDDFIFYNNRVGIMINNRALGGLGLYALVHLDGLYPKEGTHVGLVLLNTDIIEEFDIDSLYEVM